ncbi:MAG: sugar-binding protein, partial [Phycisphaeraceae bacterium JB051]
MFNHLSKWFMAFAIASTVALPSWGQINMIGRQSQNEGIMVLPATKPVEIDGSLSDWNTTGRIRCFADQLLSDRYGTQVTAMWDQTYLYLAIDWNDPTPMGNFIDPRFNPDTGWKSDCVQLRFKTADQITWIDGWYHKPSKSSVIQITVWDDMNNWRQNKARSLVAQPGSNALGEDAQQAFAKTDSGYVQELRIPWKMITRKKPDLHAGMNLQIGMEFLWGDPAGSDKLTHRYADNIQAGITSREFYWNNHRVWGNATLTDQPQVALRQYQPKTDRLTGPVPIKLTLPSDAKIVSLAIDDDKGNRVRNIGGLNVSEYATHRDDQSIQVTIPWDTMGDAVWKGNYKIGYEPQHTPVASGQYTVKALCHPGIDATYEMSFYNPGTPTWDVADGSGAWCADHTPPHIVAASGSNMIIASEFAEGGWGIIGLNQNGRKIWSEKRGARAMTVDDQFVYVVPENFGAFSPPPAMIRLDAATGDYKPFIKNGKELPFVLHLSEIFASEQLGKPDAIAVGKNYLAIAYKEHDRIALLDKHDASFVRQLTVNAPTAMTYNAMDQLVVISKNQLCIVDQKTAKTSSIPTPGLDQAVGLNCDANGNYLTFDAGPDSQVKAYTSQGQLAYTCGQKGGRAIRGTYDPNGIMHGSSVAMDKQGNVWVTESWDYPRRVSVWDQSGKLVKDYLGNTGYSGNATTLHDSDPTLAYLGPLEFKIDHDKRSWKLQSILWHPDKTKGESFEIPTYRFAKPQRFSSDASGKKREYFLSLPYYNQHGYILLMQLDSGNWQPVTAITTVSQLSGELQPRTEIAQMPSGEWADCDLLDGVFWNDTNQDGMVQRSECTIVK